MVAGGVDLRAAVMGSEGRDDLSGCKLGESKAGEENKKGTKRRHFGIRVV